MIHALWRHRENVNYNGPKVDVTTLACSEKYRRIITNYMQETPQKVLILARLLSRSSKNATFKGKIRREV